MKYWLVRQTSFLTPIVERIRSTLGLGGQLRDWICEAWLIVDDCWQALATSIIGLQIRYGNHSLVFSALRRAGTATHCTMERVLPGGTLLSLNSLLDKLTKKVIDL